MQFLQNTKQKLFTSLLIFLKAGSTPHKLSVALTLGIIIGIIPLLGTTTLLCAIAAFVFGLNMPALQLVNYLIFPLQLLLYIPFFSIGSKVFTSVPLPGSFEEVGLMMDKDVLGTIQHFWFANLQAIGAWLILSIPLYFILYFLFLRIIQKISLKRQFDKLFYII